MNREAWEARRKRDKEILKALHGGKSLNDVATDFGLSDAAIRAIARPYNLLPTKEALKQERANIIEDYRAGRKEKRLAKKYNRSLESVYGFLTRNLPDYVRPGATRRKMRNQSICEAYIAGMTLKEAASKFKLNKAYIKRILIDAERYRPLPTGRPKKLA